MSSRRRNSALRGTRLAIAGFYRRMRKLSIDPDLGHCLSLYSAAARAPRSRLRAALSIKLTTSALASRETAAPITSAGRFSPRRPLGLLVLAHQFGGGRLVERLRLRGGRKRSYDRVFHAGDEDHG